jgi:hypothetical protein
LRKKEDLKSAFGEPIGDDADSAEGVVAVSGLDPRVQSAQTGNGY